MLSCFTCSYHTSLSHADKRRTVIDDVLRHCRESQRFDVVLDCADSFSVWQSAADILVRSRQGVHLFHAPFLSALADNGIMIPPTAGGKWHFHERRRGSLRWSHTTRATPLLVLPTSRLSWRCAKTLLQASRLRHTRTHRRAGKHYTER